VFGRDDDEELIPLLNVVNDDEDEGGLSSLVLDGVKFSFIKVVVVERPPCTELGRSFTFFFDNHLCDENSSISTTVSTKTFGKITKLEFEATKLRFCARTAFE